MRCHFSENSRQMRVTVSLTATTGGAGRAAAPVLVSSVRGLFPRVQTDSAGGFSNAPLRISEKRAFSWLSLFYVFIWKHREWSGDPTGSIVIRGRSMGSI